MFLGTPPQWFQYNRSKSPTSRKSQELNGTPHHPALLPTVRRTPQGIRAGPPASPGVGLGTVRKKGLDLGRSGVLAKEIKELDD